MAEDRLKDDCDVCFAALVMPLPATDTMAYDILDRDINRILAEHPNHEEDD